LLRRRGALVAREDVAREGQTAYLGIAAGNESWNLNDELLSQLRLRYRLLVLTGRMRSEYAPVWGPHADSRFERVWCRDDFDGLQPKPSPDMLLAVLSQVKLESAIYIGNSVDDMRAASEAGLGRIAVRSTTSDAALRTAGAEYVIDTVNDLGEVIAI
jgi:phosphoglycolate phosphatase-like HAD superfamily hydrolase